MKFNMNREKSKRIFSGLLAIIIIVTMIAGMIFQFVTYR